MHHEAGVCGQGGEGRSHLFSRLQQVTGGERNIIKTLEIRNYVLDFLKKICHSFVISIIVIVPISIINQNDINSNCHCFLKIYSNCE